MQFNFSMRKLRYWIFWILPSCHFFHNWDYWQLLFTFGKAETVIHKAETHSHLDFTSYRFLQISSSILDFHTLDVVILQYRSSIRILNMQKIKQYMNSSALILPRCCFMHSISLMLCSLPSSSILLTFLNLCGGSPPYSPASISETSNTVAAQKELIQKGRKGWGGGGGSSPLYPLVQLAVLCACTEDFSSRTKSLGLGVRRQENDLCVMGRYGAEEGIVLG